jgi:hypothetical protein
MSTQVVGMDFAPLVEVVGVIPRNTQVGAVDWAETRLWEPVVVKKNKPVRSKRVFTILSMWFLF